ncbi:DoxX family protein [Streptomyces sp. PSKA30]|uniref:DoxX family protein n=1 Tax=Streptomyces sp. PSKA30 TaxID=2874597 RepID=UPI001CD05B24|nr:DoxX family protein [Streptomyces sp. PSKA30]MBZ9643398.1 DoxX family protein [Streptomyces sp. PSKA30]
MEQSLVLDQTQQNSSTTWSAITRVAFRFFLVYFGLFCLGTQIFVGLLGIVGWFPPEVTLRWIQMRPILDWAAVNIFHLDAASLYVESGSGDRAFDWVSLACWLFLAGAATLIWSVLDRRRMNYVTLHKWFRLLIRFSLAGQMISYGAAKAIPAQMPFPSLEKLVQPFGSFSPMGVLWSQVGVSQPYEILLGCAELLAGLLLILPRTTTLGALLCLVETAHVFILNMTYDVPVKILSFHLILLSLVLLAPDFRRLANFFLSSRAVAPSTQPQLFRTRRANRIASAAQVALGLWILVPAVLSSWVLWDTVGGGRDKSPLYGIWNVAEFSVDGQQRPPLLTDNDRWRRVIFDDPAVITYQHMDDSLVYNEAKVDIDRHTIALTNSDDESRTVSFTFEQPAADRLALGGELNGHKVRMSLERVDTNTFTLMERGFHWVQEYPYNR